MRLAIAIAALAVSSLGLVGAVHAQDMDLMQYADTDTDGKVTLAEYTAFAEQGWGFFAPGADKVKISELDDMAKGAFAWITPDANGEVTKTAYVAGIPERFKAADKDGNGTLSAAELNATTKPRT